MSRRWRNPLVSRRRRLEVPWIPPVAPTAPQLPPQVLATKRRAPVSRRGRTAFFAASSDDLHLISPPTRRRSATRARRGRMFETPWVPPAVAPPALVASTLDPARRKQPLRARHGTFFLPPWPQQTAPAAPPFVPDELQHAVRLVTVRRGRFAVPPWTQQATPPPAMPPSLMQQNVLRGPQARRGHFLRGTVPASDLPQQALRRMRRQAPSRRGKIASPPLIVSLAGPGPLGPKLTRPVTRRAVLARRGRFLVIPLTASPGSAPGFVCQDFSAAIGVDAYSGTVTIDAYSGIPMLDAYSGTTTVDTYGGTATNCGR